MTHHALREFAARCARSWRALVCCAGLGLIAPGAWALDQSAVYVQMNGAGGARVLGSGGGSAIARSYTGALSGEVSVMEQFNAANPAGKSWVGNAARKVPWSEIARGVSALGPLLGTGIALASTALALQEIYCHYDSAPASWVCSPFTDPGEHQETQYRVADGNWGWYGPWASSPAAACAAFTPGGAYPNPGYLETPTSLTCIFTSTSGGQHYSGVEQQGNTVYGCPSDSYTLSGDRCYNLSESVPATPLQVADSLVQHAPQSKQSRAADMLREMVEHGQTLQDGGVTASGPAQTAGGTSTTTGPNGTTTTNNYYNHVYEGDTITYNTTTTKTETDPEGNTKTETTTSDTPMNDAKTQCDLYPDSLGCLKLGEAPNDEVPKSSKDISFSAEETGLPSGCPADQPIGNGMAVSYASACEAAGSLKPFLIGAATISAALMIIFALRQ